MMSFLTPFTFYLNFTVKLRLRCYSFDKTHSGNDEQWFNWVDKFGVLIQENRDVPVSLKKDILRTVLDNIIVDYDKVERVHRLEINFKIPVMFRDEVHPKGGSQVVIKSPKSGRKPQNQLTTVGNYSTVTDLARLRGWSTLHPRITAM